VVFGRPPGDVLDGRGQVADEGAVVLQREQESGEKGARVHATLARARTQVSIEAALDRRGADEPQREGRQGGDRHQHRAAPGAARAAALQARAEVPALHVAEGLLDLHPLAMQAHDLLGRALGKPRRGDRQPRLLRVARGRDGLLRARPLAGGGLAATPLRRVVDQHEQRAQRIAAHPIARAREARRGRGPTKHGRAARPASAQAHEVPPAHPAHPTPAATLHRAVERHAEGRVRDDDRRHPRRQQLREPLQETDVHQAVVELRLRVHLLVERQRPPAHRQRGAQQSRATDPPSGPTSPRRSPPP
jgi:hypothetical protein